MGLVLRPSRALKAVSPILISMVAMLGSQARGQAAVYTGVLSNVPTGTLNYAYGVAVDSSGNVYIANSGLSQVLKETLNADGTYTESAIGSGLYFPGAITVDTVGNVYIADTDNNRVVKETVSGSNYTQSIVATGLSVPYGIAVDGNGNIFVADTGNSRILEEVPSGSGYTQSVIIPGLAATAVAVDSAGNLYLCDSNNQQVLKETLSGSTYSQSTIATGIGHPSGLAVDGSGIVFVTDLNTSSVGRLLAEVPSLGGSYQQSVIYTGATGPYGITVGANETVYWTNIYTNQVGKAALAGAAFGNIAVGSSSALSLTFTFTSSGSIGPPFIVTQGAANLDFTDAGTGTCTSNGSTHAYGVGESCTVNVAFRPTVPGLRTGAVELQTTAGATIATAFVQGFGIGPQVSFLPYMQSTLTLPGVTKPYAAATDQAGNLFVLNTVTAHSSSNALVKESWNGSGYTQSTIASGFSYPVSVAVDGAGSIYVADQDATDIVKETPSGSGYTQSIPFSGLGNVESVAVDGAGNVYIGSLSYGLLKETWFPGSLAYIPKTISPNTYPFALAADSSQNVYVSSTGSYNGLYKETLSGGSYTQSAISTAVQGSGIAVDADGNLFVAQSFTGNILKLTPSGSSYNQTTSYSINGNVNGLALDPSGNLYVAGSQAGSVTKFDFADPPSLSFANTAVGSTSSSQTVTLQNIGNAGLTFPVPSTGNNPAIAANFTLNSSTGSACPLISTSASSPGSLAAGSTCSLPISFAPAMAGPISGSLTLTDTNLNASAPGYVQQQIALSGTGLAVPVITWTPAPITYGTTLSAAQLNASASVAGTFVYSPTVGAILSAGSQNLSVTFTPTDTARYASTTATATLVVNKAPLTVVPKNVSRAYGGANPALSATLNGVANNDQLSVTGSTTATTASPVGAYPITYTVTGANVGNYSITAPSGTLTVTAATASINWTAPPAITYGSALSAAQLNAAASVPGTFVYTPALGVVLPAGTQTLSVSFTPTDTTDYSAPAPATVSLTVNKATLTISANNAARVYGAANPTFTGAISGAVNGDSFAESFSSAATAAATVGSYPIVPSASGASLANYTVVPTNGTLTITQAGSATSFALSNNNLTFTATVASLTSGTPTGTVSFYSGQNLVGNGTLANGIASYTASSFPAGDVILSAQYSGDTTFTQSNSPPTSVLTVTPAQASIAASQSGSASDTFTFTTVTGFSGVLQFACSGLPKNSACAFQPSSITLGSNPATTILTIQTGVSTAKLNVPLGPGDPAGRRFSTLASLFCLPCIFLVSLRRGHRKAQRIPANLLLALLLLLGVLSAGLTACGSHPTTPDGSSSVQVLVTGPSGVSQTSTLNLTVQ